MSIHYLFVKATGAYHYSLHRVYIASTCLIKTSRSKTNTYSLALWPMHVDSNWCSINHKKFLLLKRMDGKITRMNTKLTSRKLESTNLKDKVNTKYTLDNVCWVCYQSTSSTFSRSQLRARTEWSYRAITRYLRIKEGWRNNFILLACLYVFREMFEY